MNQLIVVIILFFTFNSRALENVSLDLVESKYVLDDNVDYHSCMIAKHRAKQRQKVLREYAHHNSQKPTYRDFFFVNDYLMNKYFLDFSVWNDEVVSIRSVWKISEENLKGIKDNGEDTYFWLIGDGVSWVEKVAFFPEDVVIDFNFEEGTIVTVHKTYYHDYCFPEKEPQLFWFSQSHSSYQSTQEMIDEFLEDNDGV